MERRKVIIIGSGPAGYTAAIYAARANLHPVIFEGFFSGPAGGQLMTTTEVENYPGFPEGITGPELMDAFRKQCERFGTLLIREDVDAVELSSHPFKVIGKKHSFLADSIIIATGATAKRLDIPVQERERRNFGNGGLQHARFVTERCLSSATKIYL